MRLWDKARVSEGVPFLCLLVAATFFVSGCGGGLGADQRDTVAVDGTVMYKGDPVEGATVTFFMDTAPRTASGKTDADGKYQLTMYEPGDGAVVGSHKVTITKVKAGTQTSEADALRMLDDPSALAGQGQSALDDNREGPESLIPGKYADRSTSGLTAEVQAEGRNTFPFELTDD